MFVHLNSIVKECFVDYFKLSVYVRPYLLFDVQIRFEAEICDQGVRTGGDRLAGETEGWLGNDFETCRLTMHE